MAFRKFGRNYRLYIQTTDFDLDNVAARGSVAYRTIVVEPPLSLDFDITRNVLTSANVASFTIYNLSETVRNSIRKNHFDYDDIRTIELRAGYGSNMPLIFSGNISQAWSVREGTDFKTTIECFDGGYAFVNGKTDLEFPGGSKKSDIVQTLCRNLPGIAEGVISAVDERTLSRGNSYSGNTMDILQELTGGKIFIDNGKVHVLDDNDCLQGDIEEINSSSGLLGTPVREQTIINFDMIFEPRMKVGQLIRLDSETGKHLNGAYKVISLKHKGMISGSVGGSVVTSVGLFYGTGQLTVVG